MPEPGEFLKQLTKEDLRRELFNNFELEYVMDNAVYDALHFFGLTMTEFEDLEDEDPDNKVIKAVYLKAEMEYFDHLRNLLGLLWADSVDELMLYAQSSGMLKEQTPWYLRPVMKLFRRFSK